MERDTLTLLSLTFKFFANADLVVFIISSSVSLLIAIHSMSKSIETPPMLDEVSLSTTVFNMV